MTSLTAIFGSSNERSDDNEQESEKLLKLYWNRAELKKEFAELRDECFRLQDRVAEQESVAARAEQQLEQLEHLLLDPATVHNTLAYYQLRSLNLQCQSRVAQFAELLKRQREQRVHSQMLASWNEQRRADASEIERKIGEQRIQVQMLEDRLQSERQRLARMSSFVKFFRKRSITAELDSLASRVHDVQACESNLLEQLEENLNRQPPDTQGLDVATKRTINFMIIAYAQQQFLLLKKNDLAILAKEAGDKSVAAVSYGDKNACDAILSNIRKGRERLEQNKDFAEDLQMRAQQLAEGAKFRGQGDAVPTADSVANIVITCKDGTAKSQQGDLLGENYWNLSAVVSR